MMILLISNAYQVIRERKLLAIILVQLALLQTKQGNALVELAFILNQINAKKLSLALKEQLGMQTNFFAYAKPKTNT